MRRRLAIGRAVGHAVAAPAQTQERHGPIGHRDPGRDDEPPRNDRTESVPRPRERERFAGHDNSDRHEVGNSVPPPESTGPQRLAREPARVEDILNKRFINRIQKPDEADDKDAYDAAWQAMEESPA